MDAALPLQELILTEDDVPGAKLLKDVCECTVVELKHWLECHGQKKCGKKAELQERVRGSTLLDFKVDPKIDDGKWYNLKKCGKVVEHQNINFKDDAFPVQGWKEFPSLNIPTMFNYGHVYHYLVESVDHLLETEGDNDDFAEDTVTAKPLRKGRNLLESNFIENLQNVDDDSHYFVRAHVHHSMKSDLPLQVFVSLSKASGYTIFYMHMQGKWAWKMRTCCCSFDALK